MTTVSIDEIRSNPDQFLERIQAGEVLLITDADQPVARTEPLSQTQRGLRPFGLAAGSFRVPDDFDAPLPDDIMDQFEAA